METITKTQFNFPGQTDVYYGKVRDVYTIEDKYMVMIASDRISAFDVILPKPIPYKGQVLNKTATYFLNLTRDICPNWLIDSPAPSVSLGYRCEPYKVEMVIRGYLTGHSWREYKSGKRELCGVRLPEGMNENDPFPEPIITPATKAEEGHDEDISREEIIKQGIVSEEEYIQLEKYTRALFKFGSMHANNQGLILVDTKYEFGKYEDKIMLIDEIHTPDSSRYFYLDTYAHNQEKGEPQKHLSKEFVREWLISKDFMGKEGQEMPEMTDDFIQSVSNRYIHLYEKVTGNEFTKEESGDTEQIVTEALSKLS